MRRIRMDVDIVVTDSNAYQIDRLLDAYRALWGLGCRTMSWHEEYTDEDRKESD